MASGEGSEGSDQERDFALDALGADGPEEWQVFAKGVSQVLSRGVTDCIPMKVEGLGVNGILAIGDGRALVQCFGDEMDFDATMIRSLIN